ncbi:MAG: hypothetical protein JST80_11450 [Bdellovibrionales bacterium]|nr:hypothetical protein [Bdellovibrionales bacterium]
MSYDFESFLQVKRARHPEISAFCPFHSDRNPSFSANIETGFWKCFAGCGAGSYSHFLRMIAQEFRYSHPKNLGSSKDKSSSATMKKVAEYFYCNLSGHQRLKVVRLEDDEGNKSFYQSVVNNLGQWSPGGTKELLLPYRYKDWSHSHDPIIIVEGEKCAEYLTDWGYRTTTFVGGSNGWKSHYISYLKGKEVIILPDNDEPGLNFAQVIYESLTNIANVRVVQLPGLGTSEDVVDWLKNRLGTIEDFELEIMKNK